MHVLLVATYEMGHPPLSLARAAADLHADGHVVSTLDLSVESRDDEAFARADAIAVSVPMHTAMRLALTLIAELRIAHPTKPFAFFGLYAGVSRGETHALGLSVIEVPTSDAFRAWLDAGPALVEVLGRGVATSATPDAPPRRSTLPSLEHYAHLQRDGTLHLAGYVESTTGCAHRCRHCPVPVVHDGRVHRVDPSVVVADALAQVAAGASHITFGDPDFLNAPSHALRVARALHAAVPHITFDVTVKVEHVIREAALWDELATHGCLFVISAFESTDDHTLRHLDKSHT
ncbi:MAG TPA: radical SAM protein, partial [Acidimicrobiales bacterium]|nr:radical SAM protein [Acidimicrobiales bacterium]